MEKPSVHRKVISTMVVLVVLPLLISILPTSAADRENEALRIYGALASVDTTTTEYVYMTGEGASMYPTINAGDRVKVQFYTNGSSIAVGDIIVFHAWIVGALQERMWIGHRVIHKYREGDEWFFLTKGDNRSKPDGWKVPEYAILGTIISVEPAEWLNASTETQSQEETSNMAHPVAWFPKGSETLIMSLGGLCLGGIIAIYQNLKRKRQEIVKRASVILCYTCRYCEIESKYRVELVKGRIRVQKVLDFTRGFCRNLNQDITSFPRRDCKQYEMHASM